ncbi:MAG: VOC family protein [Symploca sp. SIO2B6]|nr:VOC family protein [Symploca sp. SIO2B6]
MNVKRFIQSFVAVIITVFLLLGFTPSTQAAGVDPGPGGTTVEKFVERVNVSNMSRALHFYNKALGMAIDFSTPDFSQLHYKQATPDPDVSNLYIGLSESSSSNGSNKATTTIFVSDIQAAHSDLTSKGITFEKNAHGDEICSASSTISLAFFCDPDNNSLALGQDSPLGHGSGGDNCPSPSCPVH